MKKIFIFLSVLSACVHLSAQQQPLYTQFMYNKISLNPAFAGHDEFIHLNLLYRNQWIGLNGAPKTQQLSLNMPVSGQNIGLGLNLTRHTIGVSEMLTAEGIYAYKFKLQSGIFSIGTQVSLRNFSIDYSDPRISSIDNIGLDPSIPQAKQTKQILNFGLGLYYHNEKMYVGVSFPRIMKANIDFDDVFDEDKEVQHLLAMGGLKYPVSDHIDLTNQLLLRYSKNSPISVDINNTISFYDKYCAGITLRTGGNQNSLAESLDFIFSAQMNEKLMVGFAYDITLSKLREYNSGSVELLVHFNLGIKGQSEEFVNPRYF